MYASMHSSMYVCIKTCVYVWRLLITSQKRWSFISHTMYEYGFSKSYQTMYIFLQSNYCQRQTLKPFVLSNIKVDVVIKFNMSNRSASAVSCNTPSGKSSAAPYCIRRVMKTIAKTEPILRALSYCIAIYMNVLSLWLFAR